MLTKETSELPEEKLPLLNLPMADCLLHSVIRAEDFFHYFDPAVAYVGSHDVVLHIAEEGKEDKLLLRAELYQRLIGSIEVGEEKKDAIVEFSVDPEEEKTFRELIAPTGFTLEQMVQMFFCWCAHYPEDAMAWLKKAAQEHGVALAGEARKDTE